MDRTTGIPGLDLLMGGLFRGDNVVFVGDDGSDHPAMSVIDSLFLSDAPPPSVATLRMFIVTIGDPVFWREHFRGLGIPVTIVDARADSEYGEPVVLANFIINHASSEMGRQEVLFAFENLSICAWRWGPERAYRFYVSVCPGLFELGAFAYWISYGVSVHSRFVEKVRATAQVMLEVTSEHVRVLKADGRPGGMQGGLGLTTVASDGRFEVSFDDVHGRLSRGLGHVRQAFGLSKTTLAQLGGVSASAISQAESGRRGLSLSTVLQISQALGVTLDDLLGGEVPGYLIARTGPVIPSVQPVLTINDPSSGVRVYSLVMLAHRRVKLAIGGTWAFLVIHEGMARCRVGDDEPLLKHGETFIVRDHVMEWIQAVGFEDVVASLIVLEESPKPPPVKGTKKGTQQPDEMTSRNIDCQ